MTRICATILFALATVACAEEPAPQAQQQAPAAEAPAPAAEQPAAEVDDETSIQIAQEMDDAEDVAADSEADDENVMLAANEPQSAPVPAHLERYQPGTHYRVMTPVQPTSVDPGKVEVLEMFWYGCPHCYTLEPHISQWVENEMPDNAVFIRIPATLNRGWQVHARAFFTAEALGKLDEMHEGFFRALMNERNPLNTEDLLVEFFGRYGVSEDEFLEAFNSFAVQTKLRRADSLARRYRITGVPAVAINGKYVTGADMAGGVDQLFDVMDFLIEKESP